MRKLIILSVLLVLCFSVYAASVTYVYRNNVSSTDFDAVPRKGSVFTSGKNLFVVKESHSDVVVFDRIYTRSTVLPGDELKSRSRLKNFEVSASLKSVIADFAISTKTYPFEPVIAAGFRYYDKSVFVGAGVKTFACLADLWDTSFTLIEDGKLEAVVAIGTVVSPSVNFGSVAEIAYRHNVGPFCWGLGIQSFTVGKETFTISPEIGIGVVF